MRRIDPVVAAAIMRGRGLDPLVPYPGAAKPWPCKCRTCGKETSPSLAKVKDGQGCKWCAPNAPVDPDVALAVMRARDLEPLVPYPGRNNLPWRSRCLVCGSEVTPIYANVQQPGGSRGCQTCKASTLRALRLSETPVEQALQEMRDSGLEPLGPFPGTNSHWPSRCMRCGKETSPSLSHIRRPGRVTGCKWCANKVPIEPDSARAVMVAARLEPLDPFPGTQLPWRCRCMDCGTTVHPVYYTIKAGGGCRGCARRGFRPDQPAFVYLVSHEEYHAVKVGIGNVSADRLDRHRKNGWAVLAVVHMSGERAPVVERAILDWWRKDLGLPKYLSSAEMPNRGWTETVDADEIDIPATIERIRALALVKSDPVIA